MIDVNEVKAIIRRFEEKEGVRGVIICDNSGLPIKSNLSTDMTEEVSAYITSLMLSVTPRARNLAPFVTIGPEELDINPGETKEVKIELSLPANALANGSHTLTILPEIITAAGTGVKAISTSDCQNWSSPYFTPRI